MEINKLKDTAKMLKMPGDMRARIAENTARALAQETGAVAIRCNVADSTSVQEACHEALPVVKGLAFGSFTLGEVIPVENPEALDVVLNISQLMEKYELLDLVVEIDVSNPKSIYAYVNQVQIILGDMENGDTKIRYMAEVMKTIPKEDRGTLDLSELDKPNGTVVFRYLT